MTKRDNAYYKKRLQTEHPAIYQDWLDGKYKNLTAARRAANLGARRTRVHEMKNAWRKSTDAEREEFLKFLKAEGVDYSTPSAGGPGKATSMSGTAAGGLGFPVAVDRYLTEEAKDRISFILRKRKLIGGSGSPRTSVIMRELVPAFSNYDPSLGMALLRKSRIAAEMIEPLEKWLLDHKHL